MALYEHTFLVRQDATPAQVDALVEQMKSVIEGLNGKVHKVESWGLRSLAYRMKKNRKAHYTFLNVEAPWAAMAEVERQLTINEDVLRFMTVRVEALEEGPSAVLLRRERDERRSERDGGDRRDGDRRDGERRPPRRRDDEAGFGDNEMEG